MKRILPLQTNHNEKSYSPRFPIATPFNDI